MSRRPRLIWRSPPEPYSVWFALLDRHQRVPKRKKARRIAATGLTHLRSTALSVGRSRGQANFVSKSLKSSKRSRCETAPLIGHQLPSQASSIAIAISSDLRTDVCPELVGLDAVSVWYPHLSLSRNSLVYCGECWNTVPLAPPVPLATDFSAASTAALNRWYLRIFG
jgi:hypothetical protein